MSKADSILDHMAYVCECGCVTFYLIKSGNIECSKCNVIQNGKHNICEMAMPSTSCSHCGEKLKKGRCKYCSLKDTKPL